MPKTIPGKWHEFSYKKGYRQKRPPIGKYVLVRIEQEAAWLPDGVAVGYRKDSAGDASFPYFVVPGLFPVGGKVVAWCDELPKTFRFPK